MTEDNLITAAGLKRCYRLGGSEIKALDGVDLTVKRGEFLAVVGASGSGKSTLLNLLGGLDTPTAGTISFRNGELTAMSPRRLSQYRADEIGMVFQAFNLAPQLTALTNVELALYFTGDSPRERRRKAQDILTRLGLEDRLHHKPDDLSGGEQQRVAIARALVKNPTLLLADEPTGNLDKDNAEAIAEIITGWNRSGGTVIIATHNLELARTSAHRLLKMDYGKFTGEETITGKEAAQ